MTNPHTKRAIQSQKTKKKIYIAALQVVEKKGFANMTIQDICKAADVSVGSFYHYFQSKNDVALYHFSSMDDYYRNVLTQASLGDTAVEKIYQYFYHYAKYHMSLSFELNKQWYSPVGKLNVKKGRFMLDILKEIVQEGQENGELETDITSVEIAEFLIVVARGVALDWLYNDGNFDIVKRMDLFMKRVLPTFCIGPAPGKGEATKTEA